MTDCEDCPMWGADKNGNVGCLTHYCIENPLSEMWARQDEEADYAQRERESYEADMRAEAAMCEQEGVV